MNLSEGSVERPCVYWRWPSASTVSCTWRWWMLTRLVAFTIICVTTHFGEKTPAPVVLFCQCWDAWPSHLQSFFFKCDGKCYPVAQLPPFYCLWNLVLKILVSGRARPPMAFMTPFLQWRNWHRPPCARRLERWPWIGRLPWVRAKTSGLYKGPQGLVKISRTQNS